MDDQQANDSQARESSATQNVKISPAMIVDKNDASSVGHSRVMRESSPMDFIEYGVAPSLPQGCGQAGMEVNPESGNAGSDLPPRLTDKQPAISYERRARHKTRRDLYELKNTTKPQSNTKTQGLGFERKRKLTGSLLDDFTSDKITNKRISLKPWNSPGIFQNGRASSPFQRQRAVPGHASSETTFLQGPRQDNASTSFNDSHGLKKPPKSGHQLDDVREDESSHIRSYGGALPFPSNERSSNYAQRSSGHSSLHRARPLTQPVALLPPRAESPRLKSPFQLDIDTVTTAEKVNVRKQRYEGEPKYQELIASYKSWDSHRHHKREQPQTHHESRRQQWQQNDEIAVHLHNRDRDQQLGLRAPSTYSGKIDKQQPDPADHLSGSLPGTETISGGSQCSFNFDDAPRSLQHEPLVCHSRDTFRRSESDTLHRASWPSRVHHRDGFQELSRDQHRYSRVDSTIRWANSASNDRGGLSRLGVEAQKDSHDSDFMHEMNKAVFKEGHPLRQTTQPAQENYERVLRRNVAHQGREDRTANNSRHMDQLEDHEIIDQQEGIYQNEPVRGERETRVWPRRSTAVASTINAYATGLLQHQAEAAISEPSHEPQPARHPVQAQIIEISDDESSTHEGFEDKEAEDAQTLPRNTVEHHSFQPRESAYRPRSLQDFSWQRTTSPSRETSAGSAVADRRITVNIPTYSDVTATGRTESCNRRPTTRSITRRLRTSRSHLDPALIQQRNPPPQNLNTPVQIHRTALASSSRAPAHSVDVQRNIRSPISSHIGRLRGMPLSEGRLIPSGNATTMLRRARTHCPAPAAVRHQGTSMHIAQDCTRCPEGNWLETYCLERGVLRTRRWRRSGPIVTTHCEACATPAYLDLDSE